MSKWRVCVYGCVYACFMIFGPAVLLCCLLKKKKKFTLKLKNVGNDSKICIKFKNKRKNEIRDKEKGTALVFVYSFFCWLECNYWFECNFYQTVKFLMMFFVSMAFNCLLFGEKKFHLIRLVWF
jgi:hypothetical protein